MCCVSYWRSLSGARQRRIRSSLPIPNRRRNRRWSRSKLRNLSPSRNPSRSPEPEPEPAPEPEPEEEPENIEVSEELYDQTFTEVEETINELNEIIADRDFQAWQNYLTSGYRRTYSDPDVLEQRSQSAVLVRNDITLETLEDYFRFVVVPSRANARLDDLVFIDEETVEAIMEVNEQRYLLYLLKKIDDRWKIDTF